LLAEVYRRQSIASTVKFQTIPVLFEELDRFASLADRLANRARLNQDRELETVAIACEAALRQISGQAPLGERLLNDRIQASLTKVQDLAAVHGLFDREVAELERATSALIEK